MSRTSTKRAFALSTAAVLTGWSLGAAVAPAAADPGPGNPGQGNPGQGNPGQGNPGQGNPGQGNPGQGNPGQGNPGQGNPGQGNPGGGPEAPSPAAPDDRGDEGGQGDQGGDQGGDQESPPGNNGTVKVAGLGDLDTIPSNVAHPGCALQVEWYGFDEGADVVSTVDFAMHAPTADVGLAVAGDPTVFVGGDPAGGGTDLVGRETFTLGFDGEPHPRQGYHVELVVSTPRSLGNDTKRKVFWIESCSPDSPAAAPAAPAAPGDGDVAVPEGAAPGVGGADPAAGPGPGDVEVRGVEAVAEADADADAGVVAGAVAGVSPVSGSAVPTAVDAGAEGSALDRVTSSAGLLAAGLGLSALVTLVVGLRRHRA